jgi:hypothetical protein
MSEAMAKCIELQEIRINGQVWLRELLLFLNFQTEMGCAFGGSLMCHSGHLHLNRHSYCSSLAKLATLASH